MGTGRYEGEACERGGRYKNSSDLEPPKQVDQRKKLVCEFFLGFLPNAEVFIKLFVAINREL